ncbi:MAG: leucine-rich repeat domain-containing protein, partial [Verrucomicrobia bacterium]|nr:leucine-rich repeat domain-containing protein [Verrucomicrobiota bacterium]
MKTKPDLRRRSWSQLKESRAARTGMLLLLALPAAVQAQFNYTTNNGTITITGYAGSGGAVAIPSTINGLPVTSIGDGAFYNGGSPQPYVLTSITIPDCVTSIGLYAFAWWGSLSSATLGNGLISIADGAFADCGLTTITIPGGVTSIGDVAFAYCGNLTGAYFQGNVPSLGGLSVFQGDNNIVYYWCGTTGWGPTFGGRPTAPWYPPGEMCTYTTNNGTITITGYCGPGGNVTIPNTINGLPVTSIGSNTFHNCWNLTSVTIPDSVIS